MEKLINSFIVKLKHLLIKLKNLRDTYFGTEGVFFNIDLFLMFMDHLRELAYQINNQQLIIKNKLWSDVLPEWWQFFSLLHQLEKMLIHLLSQG